MSSAPKISERDVTLTASDGHRLTAFEAGPAGGGKGGLVILQEIFGLTDQLKSVVRSWARDGYDTLIPALFDRIACGTVVPFDDPDRGRALVARLDGGALMRDIAAAVKAADRGHGVSILGFCWGGGIALRAACELDLKSSVSYYGTKLTSYLDRKPRCPLLFHFGETDTTNTPPDVIEAVRAAIPTAETHIYKAGHAFANDARKTYVADAAAAARERSLAFLNQHHRVSAPA
jgi:carboxymethylenebutenolidase